MEILEGRIIKYIFQNKDNNFNIAVLETQDDRITINGYFLNIPLNISYRFYGDYENHPKYGLQFKVSKVIKVNENTKEGIITYLSSDLFKGIGEKTATKIYEKLGKDCINIILKDINVLNQFKFNKEKKESFYKALKQNETMDKVLIELYDYGITPKMALKLYDKYNIDTIPYIKSNPYKLINEIERFSFISADNLAKKLNIDKEDPRRIKACLLFVLKNVCFNKGFTYLTYYQLTEETYLYLIKEDTINRQVIDDNLKDLINDNIIISYNNNLYLKLFYDAELKFSTLIKKFNKKDINEIPNLNLDTKEIIYTNKQKEAIIESLKNQLTIITGGPGTGKTTVIKGIITNFEILYPQKKKILLMAPTGRASKRLMEKTSHEAKTIHRHLGYDYTGKFTFNEDNKLEANLIIIDEASMIDIFLFNNLFEAINDNTQIVIVGDYDQLPSVQPGQVLKELIDSKIIKTVILDEIHRQAKESSIIKLAFDINHKIINNELFNKKDDLFFIKTEKIKEYLITIINKLIHQNFSLLDDIQILIPLYKGECGIDNINKLIQNEFNKNKEEIKYNSITFKNNDKVLQLVNNPEKGVMNGDIGIIHSLKNTDEIKYIMVNFDGTLVKYNYDELEQLTLAYAISIHKSQGSEYKIVILPIISNYYIMLNKKILYTAITRAKERLIILGNYKYLNLGVKKLDDIRQTSLKNFLLP